MKSQERENIRAIIHQGLFQADGSETESVSGTNLAT